MAMSFISVSERLAGRNGSFTREQLEQALRNEAVPVTALTVALIFSIVYISICASVKIQRDGVPVVNRTFFFEPDLLARLRWAFNARAILDYGHHKVVLAPMSYIMVLADTLFSSKTERITSRVAIKIFWSCHIGTWQS
jgi:hypothetical protein